MLREGSLGVEVEVDAPSSSAATEGPITAAYPARGRSGGVVIAIVGGGHNCSINGDLSRRVEFVYSLSRSEM